MARKVDILIAVLALICVFAGFWEETGLLILIAGLVCYLFLYERPCEAIARFIKNRKGKKESRLTW